MIGYLNAKFEPKMLKNKGGAFELLIQSIKLIN